MVELALREAGWRAVSCGCGLPPATVAAAIRRLKPRLCWLSVSTLPPAVTLAEFAGPVHAAAQENGTLLVVGGRAAPPETVVPALPGARAIARLSDLPPASDDQVS